MKQFSSTIIKNVRICNDFFLLEFSWDPDATKPKPGQFLTIRITDNNFPLLRRPFAISSFDERLNTASIIYQRRGKGTDLLAAKVAQEQIDLIGPLGNSFPMPNQHQKAVLVAGGIGLGPILFLSSTLYHSNTASQLIFGCRNQLFIPKYDLFESQLPVICTDDGSAGFQGTVSDYLLTIWSTISADTVFYSCGPNPMLQACHQLAQKNGLPSYVSVEQVMACGVGACMGCVVKVKQAPGYARACKEGPVFSSYDMVW